MLFIGSIDCMGQLPIELTSIKYQSYGGKTLSFLEIPEIYKQLISSLDSFSRKFLKQPMVKSDNFSIYQEALKEVEAKSTKQPVVKPSRSTKTNFELTITEMPLSALLKVPEMDSAFIKELLQKQTVGFFQFQGKLISANGELIMNRELNVVLSRNRKTIVIGFLHPEYLISPKSFSKLFEVCMPILIDSSNETEIIQMTTVPAITADNFIQPYIKNAVKHSTNVNKGIIQYIKNNQLQYLRYQTPVYEPIVLRSKKQSPIPSKLLQSIFDNQVREPLFLREESRDILADKNYLLQTLAYLEMDNYSNSFVARNIKTGLPFRFLPGAFHVLLQDKDTIAIFSVEANKKYPSKNRFYHQLYSSIDSTDITVSTIVQEGIQIYSHELNGVLKGQPFQILNSGMHGSPGNIREIFYNKQLVCIAQGKEFPELIALIDESIDTVTFNQLLLIAYSSLF